MDPIQAGIEAMSNPQLRKMLIDHGVVDCGPVVKTTRKVYENLMMRLISAELEEQERQRGRRRRLNQTAEEQEAEAGRGRQRRLNQTTQEQEAEAGRGRQRRLNQATQEQEAEAGRGRQRRLNQTTQEQEAEAGRGRQRRLNATAEERETEARRARQRYQQKKNKQPRLFRAAVVGTEFTQAAVPHELGAMENHCVHDCCRALHFAAEHGRLLHSCCHNGKSMAPPLSEYPNSLRELLTGDSADSRNFREHIRQYNSANAFASFGAKIETMPAGRGPYCFKISGEVYHLATSALVQNGPDTPPSYGQLFVYDPDAAVQFRMHVRENAECHASVMQTIDQEMRRVSPYAHAYRQLHEAASDEETRARSAGVQPMHYVLRFIRDTRDDARRYNEPQTNKECMYLVEGVGGNIPAFDLAVHPRGERGCTRIGQFSRHVDPMVFPLLFPLGDSGWTIGARNSIPGSNSLTPLQFYSSRIAARGQFNPIHSGGKLFQQFLVHAYCTVEAQRLLYLERNQTQLRAECYTGLIDYLAHAAEERSLRPGNLVVLPSTFIGGPRYMRQKYMDAMTIVRRFGRPVYFVTFTCNPRWPEIIDHLATYQQPCDRPDIESRVFLLKVEELIRLVTKESIFGQVIAYVYVIEFQKRGLPHVHSLFWLAEEGHLRTADDVDRVISAEIPNREDDPELYEIVLRNNMHGPCGEHWPTCDLARCRDHNPKCPCMKDGSCKKMFPKAFQENTDLTGESYPKYQRRDNRHQNHTVRGGRTHNGFVVPYNAFLSKTFNAHINVEMCHTITAIKYLCKYFMKGHDRAKVGLAQDAEGRLTLNEIKSFVDTRCITPPEAIWRLTESPLHEQSHAIYELAVHIENGQHIFFHEGREEEALRLAATKKTTLTAWFQLNSKDEVARQYLYQDIPAHYTFNKSTSAWKERQRPKVDESVLGRIANVSPRQVEPYHLRLLLLHIPGATSFEFLRTVDGVLYATYKEAARAHGLIVDDREWYQCMEEASLYMMPHQLRSLFVVLLVHCDVLNPADLWDQFRSAMIEDFQHQGYEDAPATSLALIHIAAQLEEAGFSLAAKGLPEPEATAENIEAIIDNPGVYAARGGEMIAMLNQDQRTAADAILAKVNENDTRLPNCFFIDGPGGSGKTFLYIALINILRGNGKRVLPVAWTGIAAILLPGGQTSHTAFRLPLNLDKDSACRLTTKEKENLLHTDVIIWDEVSMADKHALALLDRCLRDITQNDHVPFGGKFIILGGDFRQVLPVVPGGSRAQIIAKCVKSSDLWVHFRQLQLRVNMRAGGNEGEYANWLLRLGDDTLALEQHAKTEYSVAIPPQCVSDDVVSEFFPSQFDGSDPATHQRVILSPFNEDARLINERILLRLQGDQVTYKSIDTVGAVEGEDPATLQQMYPVEFLNSVNIAGLPSHALNVKKNAVVMLIRNLAISRGLCNGTRMTILDTKAAVIKARILTGAHAGTIHFIPRVTLDTKDMKELPFNLRRRQFPLKLAYSMTINKAQGQTLDKVGVYLRSPVFTHGQLYVACSRVRSFDALRLQVVETDRQGKIDDGTTVTDNIVFKAAL